MDVLVVLERPDRWVLDVPEVSLVAADEYLTRPEYGNGRHVRVVNLCRTYSFQTTGYYVSLLAEARGHDPFPSVATLLDLRLPAAVRVAGEELDEVIQRSLHDENGDTCEIPVYFGRCPLQGHRRLARAVFARFPAPFLHAEFQRAGGRWRLVGIKTKNHGDLAPEFLPFVQEEVRRFAGRGVTPAGPDTSAARFDLAILYDPKEVDSPSNERAVRQFIVAARQFGIDAETIDERDYARLGEYDALFIRQTTAVSHHTYRFARRAELLGLPVIDTPTAILRATNKVYQAELFARHGIPTPKTYILHRGNAEEVLAELSLPLVLKRPDSSFSMGVKRVDTIESFHEVARQALRASDLIVAQEFVPSAFDWRIGVLDGEFLFGCRYFMAPGHWQIQKTGAGRWRRYGGVEALPPEQIPEPARELGVRAARLLGEGLFGVDIKQLDDRFVVMEVNDNPNIDAGCEDGYLGEEIYRRVMAAFLRRLQSRVMEA